MCDYRNRAIDVIFVSSYDWLTFIELNILYLWYFPVLRQWTLFKILIHFDLSYICTSFYKFLAGSSSYWNCEMCNCKILVIAPTIATMDALQNICLCNFFNLSYIDTSFSKFFACSSSYWKCEMWNCDFLLLLFVFMISPSIATMNVLGRS